MLYLYLIHRSTLHFAMIRIKTHSIKYREFKFLESFLLNYGKLFSFFLHLSWWYFGKKTYFQNVKYYSSKQAVYIHSDPNSLCLHDGKISGESMNPLIAFCEMKEKNLWHQLKVRTSARLRKKLLVKKVGWKTFCHELRLKSNWDGGRRSKCIMLKWLLVWKSVIYTR